MPTTSIEGPHSNGAAGTIDGVTFAQWSNASRIHETSGGSSAVVTNSVGNIGSLYFNCFNDSQIPAGATITGMEVVAGVDFDGSGNSNFGCFGSSGASADIVAKIYLHNGTDYSSALTLDNSVATTGVSFNGDNTEVTLRGSNKRYLGLSTIGVLAGSSTSTSGLTFNASNQASFGFAIVFTTVDSGAVGGVLRGIGLRATYVEGAIAERVNTIISGSIQRFDTVAGNLIATFNGLTLVGVAPPAPPSAINITYQFEDQSTQESSNAVWSPSGDASDWVNGVSAVTDAEAGNAGTNWGKTATKQVKGWNLGQDGTTSGNTGPNGGVNTADGTHDTSSDGDRYIYCETSTGTGGVGSSLTATNRTYVTRMPGFNFSTAMANTSTDLNLKFWLHAFGAAIGDLFIYIDTNTASNHSTATLIQSYTSFSGFTANSSNWQEQTVSLNSYRTVDATHYIYFVYEGATTFTGDLAVDAVQIIEA